MRILWIKCDLKRWISEYSLFMKYKFEIKPCHWVKLTHKNSLQFQWKSDFLLPSCWANPCSRSSRHGSVGAPLSCRSLLTLWQAVSTSVTVCLLCYFGHEMSRSGSNVVYCSLWLDGNSHLFVSGHLKKITNIISNFHTNICIL